eukprot:749899-Hanusia_phi.AAC.4
MAGPGTAALSEVNPGPGIGQLIRSASEFTAGRAREEVTGLCVFLPQCRANFQGAHGPINRNLPTFRLK